MDILNYTEEHKEFRKRLRKFIETEVMPYVEEWEKNKIVPKSAWRKMGENGFLCMFVAPEYGGMGGDFLYSVIVAEEMARTNQTGLITMLHTDVVVPYIDTFGSEEIKRKYLPGCITGECITAVAMTEPGAGSDLAGMTTTAVEQNGEVVINGSKTFISSGINCDIVVLAAKDPSVKNDYQAISLYIVESGTPGFTRGRQLEKMGFHSQDTAELFFTNCRIPITNRLGQKGGGFYMLMEKLQQERLATAIGAIVAAEYILEATIDYCKKTLVSDRPISKSQAVQFALVEMSTEVKIGRIFVDKLIADHVEKKSIIIETCMAKYWTTEMVRRVADRGLDLFGDFGIFEECPIVRGWRDVRVMSIFAGTNEIMKNIAAKFMGF
ncbi:MAG: acyl-CoA dehydrogenase [Desulfobacteraceae bacterium]|nr:MAG: acyl-CoA dehydrogenase [Desulfobacteraceae bacterium]